ncbi:MAG: carboxypeptidase regulatory-like domain-containing protein [Myxococcaceae bacterium]|nr:carboxypeptidase regulatory-like domain-containing protein [Myxococcaceae bacterium]
MEKMITALALVLAACGTLEPLSAQDIYGLRSGSGTSVYGLVKNARTGAPLVGVTLLIGGRSTLSENDGTYLIEGLAPIEATGEVAVHGFQSVSVRFTLERGANLRNFELEPNECGRANCLPGEFCSSSGCSPGATLSGSVFNACDNTALDALVRIDGAAICTESSKGAFFQLKGITPNGPQVISIGKTGYLPFTKTISLNTGLNAMDPVKLTPEAGCSAIPAPAACVCTAAGCQR